MGDTNHDQNAGGAGDTDADNTQVDETVDDADTTQNTDANDDSADDTGDSDDAVSEDGTDDDGEGDSKTKSSDTADDDKAEADEDDGEEPELRKPKQSASNAEWAAWRAQEKSKKAKDDADKSGDTKGEDVDDEDEDDLSPEDRAALDKRIAKHLAPFQKQAAEQEVEASIATFVKDNPDFAPFAAKAKRFALHPSRENIPIKSIFYEVAGDKLLAIGAKRAKAADIKAKKSQTGGGTATTEKGNKSYKDMSNDDFSKELEAAKLQRR